MSALAKYLQITNKVGHEARNTLYKLVAQNIAVNVAVLSELGIFEGNDATWDNGEYHFTWEGELTVVLSDIVYLYSVLRFAKRF